MARRSSTTRFIRRIIRKAFRTPIRSFVSLGVSAFMIGFIMNSIDGFFSSLF